MDKEFTAGRYHVRFARVHTSRAMPSEAELPVYEALVMLACLGEVTLQGAAAELQLSKRWFTEGYAPAAGRATLPRAISEHLALSDKDVRAALTTLLRRGLIVAEGHTLLLPERTRRRAVLAWNAQMQSSPLAQLPRVMFPRRRGAEWVD